MNNEQKYFFRFVGGGWNTIMARSREEAIERAHEVHHHSGRIPHIPDDDTVKLVRDNLEEYQRLAFKTIWP